MVRRQNVRKELNVKRGKDQALHDADDYLAAGVDREDAMGKHRGGDPAKSLRFARKARELYTEGLSKYPNNFDLAYNKARLELEIATHPQFLQVLDVSTQTILEWSLDSHEYALSLDCENPDLLFNAAQVLTTLAEENAGGEVETSETTLGYLSRALEFQQRCYTLQRLRYAESQKNMEDANHAAKEDLHEGGFDSGFDPGLSRGSEDQATQSEWFSIVEPVTAETILDTLLAQLNTLTATCNIMNSILSTGIAAGDSLSLLLSRIESEGQTVIHDRLEDLLSRTSTSQDRSLEIGLVKANFASALLEAAYRMKAIGLKQYSHDRDLVYPESDVNREQPEFWVANAKSLISLNAAALEESTTLTEFAPLRWTVLTKAQALLTQAAKSPSLASDVDALADTHMLRGNISLLLHALALPPIDYAQARANGDQLLKNARVFYGNAGKIFKDADKAAVAKLRSIVVKALQSQSTDGHTFSVSGVAKDIQSQIRGRDVQWISNQLEDMVNEGVLQNVL